MGNWPWGVLDSIVNAPGQPFDDRSGTIAVREDTITGVR